MIKQIDAERLKELIDAKYEEFTEKAKKTGYYQYLADGLDIAEQIIDSLQKEQPEVDLEKELADYCRRYYNYDYPKQAEDGTGSSVMPHIIEAAKYFYKLGKNSK